MDKLIKPFVADKFPDFVTADHPKFKLFLEAYYEWLEQQNTGTATSVLNLFQELPNPAGLISNAESIGDIDETLDSFLDYFRKEVMSITITDKNVDRKMLIKKIRDLYLAKGTPKSFKLLFRMLYDEDVALYERKDNILRSSDGSYLAFPIAMFRVVKVGNSLSSMDFNLATIVGSGVDGILITGFEMLKDKTNRPVIITKLAEEYPIQYGERYIISNAADSSIFIEVEALPLLDKVWVEDSGALCSPGDELIFKSNIFNQSFPGIVSTVKTGSVDGLFIRDRGFGYKVKDVIKFDTDNDEEGVGGRITVTGTDKIGRITHLDGFPLRSGVNRNGYSTSVLVDATIPVTDGGFWKKLPQVHYDLKPSSNGAPWNEATGGYGLSVQPISNTIGSIGEIFFSMKPFFDSELDVTINPPTQVVVQNIDGLEEGNTVVFQTFEFNPGSEDDSEILTVTYKLKKTIFKDFPTQIKLPIDFDSELFFWKTFNYVNDSQLGIVKNDSTEAFKAEYRAAVDSESTLRIDSFTIDVDSEIIIDGGSQFEYQASQQITGESGFIFDLATATTNPDLIVGCFPHGANTQTTKCAAGDYYDYNIITDTTIEITYGGNRLINGLEDYHFDLITKLNLQKDVATTIEYSRHANTDLVVEDSGRWVNTKYRGVIRNIRDDENVITLQAATGYTYATDDSDITALNDAEKYRIIRLSKTTGATGDSESISLPLTNIVAQVVTPQLNYSLSGMAYTSRSFASERGFLSSASMNLQDNYYYSTFTYVVSTKIPIDIWKEKVKTLLHPAGTLMLSNLNVEQQVNVSAEISAKSVEKVNTRSTKFSFDTSLEHYDPNYSTPGLFADNATYSTNAFELVTSTEPLGRNIRPTSYFENTQKAFNYENGDSWWDYEPLGVVADWTTQDSDGSGYIRGFSKRYQRTTAFGNEDAPLGGRFLNFHQPNISGIKFINMLPQSYHKLDSEDWLALPQDVRDGFVRFDGNQTDSEVYKTFDYDNLRNLGRLDENGNGRLFKITRIERKKELLYKYEKDFSRCLSDPDNFVFEVDNLTFTGFDALERKWNYASSFNRKWHPEGWQVVGYTSKLQNRSSQIRKRNWYNRELWPKDYTIPIDNNVKSFVPESVNFSPDSDNWWIYNDTYVRKINTYNTISPSEQIEEPKFDVKELMKARRGS